MIHCNCCVVCACVCVQVLKPAGKKFLHCGFCTAQGHSVRWHCSKLNGKVKYSTHRKRFYELCSMGEVVFLAGDTADVYSKVAAVLQMFSRLFSVGSVCVT